MPQKNIFPCGWAALPRALDPFSFFLDFRMEWKNVLNSWNVLWNTIDSLLSLHHHHQSLPYLLVPLLFQARKKNLTYSTVDPLMLDIFATFQTRFSPLKRPYTNLTSKQKRWVRICSFKTLPEIENRTKTDDMTVVLLTSLRMCLYVTFNWHFLDFFTLQTYREGFQFSCACQH